MLESSGSDFVFKDLSQEISVADGWELLSAGDNELWPNEPGPKLICKHTQVNLPI